MEIPIYIDGEEAGTVRICRRNGLTADARLRDPGRVTRLRVFGEREFYLGVPVPEGEGGLLRLTRRLTPTEERVFPQHPAYAAEAPLGGGEDPGLPKGPPDGPQKRRVLWHGGRPHYF